MNKQFTFLVMSDIHFGNNINKTENIVLNLDYFLYKNNSKISVCDAIFIAGDMFDRLISNSSTDIIQIYEWMSRFLKYCGKNSIKIRILEGTPSHDRKQGKLVYTILKDINTVIDYRYIDIIEHEKIDDFTILYIPDEYLPTYEYTYRYVKEYLNSNNISRVDIIIMHGVFKYQLPIPNIDAADENDWLDLVNYCICAGHIHTPSVYNKENKLIVAPGSFDRLTFADEGEVKGGSIISITDGKISHTRLVNTRALKFITLDTLDSDTIKTLEKISKENETAIVRFLSDVNIDQLRQQFKNIQFSIKSRSITTDDIPIKNIETNTNVVLDRDYIYTFLLDNLKDRYSTDVIKDIIEKIV